VSTPTPPGPGYDPLGQAQVQAGAERARVELERRLAADRRRRRLFLLLLLLLAGSAVYWFRPREVSKPVRIWERDVAAEVKVTGPTIGVSPDGRWFALAWAEGPRVWWMRGTREGLQGRYRFDAPVELADREHPFAAFDEDPPKAAIDDQGQIAVAWMTRPASREEGSVIAVARPNLERDGGVAITRIEGAHPAGFLLCESIQYDDDGGLLAVWIDAGPPEQSAGEEGVLQCATATSQGAFETVTTLADSVCACCRTSVAWLGPDTYALAWRGVGAGNARDVRFGVLRETGVDGSGVPALAPDSRATVRDDRWVIEGCPSHGPVVAAAGEKAAYVAWYTEGTPKGLSLARLEPKHGLEGLRWQTVNTFAVDPREKAAFPYVVTLSSGRPFVVFEGPTPEGGRALYARRMTRQGLTPAQRFTTSTRVARPVAARWGGNSALVLWQEADETGARMALAEWKGL
jgi:hypothetical protein